MLVLILGNTFSCHDELGVSSLTLPLEVMGGISGRGYIWHWITCIEATPQHCPISRGLWIGCDCDNLSCGSSTTVRRNVCAPQLSLTWHEGRDYFLASMTYGCTNNIRIRSRQEPLVYMSTSAEVLLKRQSPPACLGSVGRGVWLLNQAVPADADCVISWHVCCGYGRTDLRLVMVLRWFHFKLSILECMLTLTTHMY